MDPDKRFEGSCLSANLSLRTIFLVTGYIPENAGCSLILLLPVHRYIVFGDSCLLVASSHLFVR